MTYNGETFNVDMIVYLNSATGLLTVIFQSIEPGTDLPPANALTGFLPPEDGTGRGMGYVSFIIDPKNSLPTGTQITNVALITFDGNPPIATDQLNDDDPGEGIDPTKEALVTIDSGPPTSSVASLSATESTPSFTVSWSGSDDPNGSGIAFYDVYVSVDGGAYTVWQDQTKALSASFTGVAGNTYSFYSVATDNVGNVQSTPTTAQATTTVSFLTAPQVTVTDNNGPYSGAPFTATTVVTGNGGTVLANDGVSPPVDPTTLSYSYYAGTFTSASQLTGLTPLTGPPTTAGSYTVVALYMSDNGIYTSNTSAPFDFTIGLASSTTTAVDAGGTYNGNPFAASGTVTGAGGLSTTPTSFSYVGTGKTTYAATSVAPTAAGNYTVTASYAGDANHSGSSSNAVPYTIGLATPKVTVTDAGGTYNGSPFAATATITGISGTPGSSLEGIGLTITYYSGTYTSVSQLTSLTGSATAPSAAGSYTVLASFAGSTDYTAASTQTNFAITVTAASFAGDVEILNGTASGALNVSGNGHLNANGSLQVDSNSASAANLSGSAIVTAAETMIVGGDLLSGNGRFNNAPTLHAPSVANPLAGLAAPTVTGNYTAVNLTGNSTLTIYPGNYPSISVSGNGRLTFSPGIYVIGSGGISFSGNAIVTGQGVLLYNAGALTLSGNANVNLTASTTGAYAGLAIFQAMSDASAVTVGDNGILNLNGAVLYAANGQSVVTLSSNGQVEASLIVNELTISGDADITAQ